MYNLYFLNYNNYYNRIVKFETSLANYLEYEVHRQLGVNFSFEDNIRTMFTPNANNVGNYVIVADEYNDIHSRWFIMESKYQRNGQHTVHLRRDVIADNIVPIMTAPIFIEKATLNSLDPMIFNAEDMTFNQIKTSETLLKDETGCPWIVGYLASYDSDNNVKTYNARWSQNYPIAASVNGIENWTYAQYLNEDTPFLGVFNQQELNGFVVSANDGSNWFFNKSEEGALEKRITNSPITPEQLDNFTLENKEELLDSLTTSLTQYVNFHTQSELTDFLNMDGKFVEDTSRSDNRIYKIEIEKLPYNYIRLFEDELFDYPITSSGQPQLFNELNAYFGNANNESFYMICDVPQYHIKSVLVPREDLALSITENRYHLENAPYDMFAIPYSDDFVLYKNGEVVCGSGKQMALDAVMELSRRYSGESARFLYDLQLLPYCPVRYGIQSDGTFDIMDNNLGVTYITDWADTNLKKCPIFFAKSDSFTFDIKLENPIVITNPKIESQCDMYRLCSPNYNGVFEFNAAKNRGFSNFNVDCTYKPYNPYIHMNPNFGGLYGQDFNDSRGLVVGGDFSLPQITSAWESYQLSNKNFQASFDRQITNMEISNSVSRKREVLSSMIGVANAGVQGGMQGGIIGAGASMAASAAAGAIDYNLSEQLRNEAIDYTKDQFGYQLGNIQALPMGLSKTSAFTYNNKIFPLLEYYTCTREEKKALENKIKYNGMTVMRIGTISEFKQRTPTYIKGKLIRLEINDDNHIVNEIANELNKGVYI